MTFEKCGTRVTLSAIERLTSRCSSRISANRSRTAISPGVVADASSSCAREISMTDWPALRLIAVEQPGGRGAVYLCGELPAEVHRILDTEVEPLAALRRVDVRRVPGEEDAAPAICRREARGVPDPREPCGIACAQIAAQDPPGTFPQLFERSLGRPRHVEPLDILHYNAVATARHRHDYQRALRLVDTQRAPVGGLGQLDIADQRRTSRSMAIECDSRRRPDGTPSPVTPNTNRERST
jgi:hypothetical protein